MKRWTVRNWTAVSCPHDIAPASGMSAGASETTVRQRRQADECAKVSDNDADTKHNRHPGIDRGVARER
ncbi:hypothetical protein [Jeongeupia sp. USM3]|uniref:hypothetical protein n=1 Tax=Jeongeupia sp. USM3 TaxID=1906741 RepID=UPI00143C869D|nr:hypothetical protein [Jeongeupia sp. USM3]